MLEPVVLVVLLVVELVLVAILVVPVVLEPHHQAEVEAEEVIHLSVEELVS